MDLKLVDLTLEKVSDGALEGRFQELLGDVMGICENAGSYVGSSDGTRTSKITLEIEVRHRPAINGDPPSTLIISGGELKRPKRHKAAQSAHVSGGGFVVVENPPEQLEVFNGEGAGGVVTPFDAASKQEGRRNGE